MSISPGLAVELCRPKTSEPRGNTALAPKRLSETQEVSMKYRLLSTVALAALGAWAVVPSIAMAQDHAGIMLTDNEALYVDGSTFGLTVGQSKGDVAAELKVLGAHEIGLGAIIIRAGNKLYLATAEDQMVHLYERSLRNFAYDPAQDSAAATGGGSAGYNATIRRNYAYDPAQDHPAQAGGGSAGYNETARRNFAYDPAQDHPAQAGGGSAGYNETARRNYAYDPDYAQYRLKKEFESHWTPIAPKS
jgi:hypothetical protein